MAKKAAKKKAAKKKVTKKKVAKPAAKKSKAKKAPAKMKAGKAAKKVAPLQVGDRAPDFNLPGDDGRDVKLSDFRGKKVVLYFYPQDDTPGCTREACEFRDRVDQIHERGAAILGVSVDPGASHQSFRTKYGLNFPLLSDAGGRVAQSYLAAKAGSNRAERMTFIIDERGRIAKIYPKVSVDVHADQVLGSL